MENWKYALEEREAHSRFEEIDDLKNLKFISNFFADFSQLDELEKQQLYEIDVEKKAKEYQNLSGVEIQSLKTLFVHSGIFFSSSSSYFFFFFCLLQFLTIYFIKSLFFFYMIVKKTNQKWLCLIAFLASTKTLKKVENKVINLLFLRNLSIKFYPHLQLVFQQIRPYRFPRGLHRYWRN